MDRACDKADEEGDDAEENARAEDEEQDAEALARRLCPPDATSVDGSTEPDLTSLVAANAVIAGVIR